MTGGAGGTGGPSTIMPMGSASGTVAAKYSLCGGSEIMPERSDGSEACWMTWGPVASAWTPEPQLPSQNGAQAAKGRKIANRLSLTLAARRFARLCTVYKSLSQRPFPLRTDFRTGHPSGAKARSHHSDVHVAEPGKALFRPRPSWPSWSTAPAERRNYTILPANMLKVLDSSVTKCKPLSGNYVQYSPYIFLEFFHYFSLREIRVAYKLRLQRQVYMSVLPYGFSA